MQAKRSGAQRRQPHHPYDQPGPTSARSDLSSSASFVEGSACCAGTIRPEPYAVVVSAPTATARSAADATGRPAVVEVDRARLYLGDALSHYAAWPTPKVIISDGPYGLRSYPGDPPTPERLADFYQPHVEAWSRCAHASTTLWFWCSEVGWATVHATLVANGWHYVRACIWDKGPGHVAGNANSRSLRQLPAVTEVCVQYIRQVRLPLAGTGECLPMKAWLRAEWLRSGLPLSRTNAAAGVKNAATRKWFTACHLWYAPDGAHLERLAEHANENGDPHGRPYFSMDGRASVTADEWDALRPTFHCPPDVHNVWREGAVRGAERIKINGKSAHMNQKPLKLTRQTIQWTSDPGDVVWEPFAGTATGLVAALEAERRGFGAELNPTFFDVALRRLEDTAAQ